MGENYCWICCLNVLALVAVIMEKVEKTTFFKIVAVKICVHVKKCSTFATKIVTHITVTYITITNFGYEIL